MTPEEQILVCAVRYALGRQSYITGVVCDYVNTKKTGLSKCCINIIIRDINEELELCHRLGRKLGMDCDEQGWVKLRDELETIHK